MQHLLVKARRGDKAAETQLFEHLRVRFVLLAKRRIGEEHCEDIAQEACITVLEKLKSDAPEDNFEAWAYQVLRNKIGNYLQSHNLRQKKMLHAEHIEDLDGPSTGEIDPMLRRRLLDCLKKILKVSPRYARALNFVQQGYDTEEICRRLDMKSNHLYVVLNRSRKMLSDCLDGGDV
ncbi:MAG: RNA polymerase sigma factor [Candidatus Zixiibacteriota bacterium]|nr:MAG: RNA polymerase sigma factor [candidate division Zixibacteria bacterium]